MNESVQLLLAGLGTGSIYALVALGFNIIFKSTGALNFAQGEWVMLGGMVAATLYAAKVPLWLALVAAVCVAMLVGAVSERLIVRRLQRPTAMSITIVTIAIAICTKSLVMLLLGKNPAGLPSFSSGGAVHFAGAVFESQSLWIIGVAALVMGGAGWFFNRTVLGKSMRAAAAQPEAAALVGISPRLTMSLSFVLAAGIGALAGVIVTPLTLTSFDHGTILGFKAFCAAMLGGLGSLPGAMVGGLALGLAESFAGGMLSSHFKDAVSFVVLLMVLVRWPNGLLGQGQVEKI
ncbi:LIV-I protein H [Variovorax sp. PBS-H4]|uniref:branched-chain amino acid ABC transporter permease n=1 Tax=Variovorax sp. PBS-H4 TaxID=434008 RepID=UPI0013173B21|nr:branched-chain amino acid ABC transporter permease [Variovorax sp. PBS-H4]VTU27599.1 LIV-I protein H [Variovorax sp. PBS-H4]